jgi:hypothetical protein
MAICRDGRRQADASNRSIHLNGGFEPGRIYEYVYVVSDPVVAGLGFAAVRDFASYVKHAPDTITPVSRVLGEGISQNGRFLRNFLYQGFNADEDGRIALDGALAHVAGAGRGSFNYRFAQPSRDAQPTSAVFFPTDIFPFTDQPEVDPLTHEKSGLLDRAVAEQVVPKIFFSNTSYEYWGRAASLIHTTSDGKRDVAIGPNVRIYHFTGLQHYSGPFPPPADFAARTAQSPLPICFFWRAMIANMDEWVRAGAAHRPVRIHHRRPHAGALGVRSPVPRGAAPRSQHRLPSRLWPELARRDSYDAASSRWESISLCAASRCRWRQLGGIHLPEISVPLATTGWNLRDPSIGGAWQRLPSRVVSPFPRNAVERKQSGDPRKSIAERYPDRRGLPDAVRAHWQTHQAALDFARIVHPCCSVERKVGLPRALVKGNFKEQFSIKIVRSNFGQEGCLNYNVLKDLW